MIRIETTDGGPMRIDVRTVRITFRQLDLEEVEVWVGGEYLGTYGVEVRGDGTWVDLTRPVREEEP